MILDGTKNNVSSNLSDVRQFTIAGTDNIFQTLSSRLYTNPIRAIIRETVSNAIDAHIMANSDEEIHLHLPSRIEPEFYVEDFGIGMDEETIFQVYTQYGNSTKGDSNTCIGGLGLGSKTPFSYTSQFTVVSCKNGIKNTYIAFLDDNGIPSISKVDSCDCDQPGTKVSFPVNLNDLSSFYEEAVLTLLFSTQMPKLIGGDQRFLSEANVSSLEEFLECRKAVAENTLLEYTEHEKAVAIIRNSSYNASILVEMGGVPYSVDSSEILGGDRWEGLLRYFVNRNGRTVLHLPIGSVNIQSSREALQYTTKTKNTINTALVKEFIAQANNLYNAA